MTTFSHRFAEAVESYEGTPWHHQGRCPGVGLDCAGLVACGLRDAGANPADKIDYPRQQDRREIQKWLETHCTLVEGEPEIGDICVFGVGGHALHIGVRTSKGLTHAFLRDGYKEGAVVIVDFERYWRSHLVSVWRYREDLV